MVHRLAGCSRARQESLLVEEVCLQVGEVLQIDPTEIPRREGFFDMGMDSLTAVQLRERLQRRLGRELAATVIMDYPDVERLVEHLMVIAIPEPGSGGGEDGQPSIDVGAIDAMTDAEAAAALAKVLEGLESNK